LLIYVDDLVLNRQIFANKGIFEKETYQISGIALASVRTHAFTITRTVVQVVAVKLRAVLSSPTGITEAYGTYAVPIVKTAVWAVDDYQERIGQNFGKL